MPDTRLVSARPRYSPYRSRLPALDGVTFIFPALPDGKSLLLNFCHMDEFFVISGKVKELFQRQFGDELETVGIRIQHQSGSPATERYFAARVNRVIDCIDPQQSTWRDFGFNTPLQTFADGLFRYELDERCSHEFANDGDNKYTSFPSWHATKQVRLVSEQIPDDTVLFQPKFWPGHWMIHESFARELRLVCSGGYDGYYFGTLLLDDVSGSHHQLMLDLR